MDAICADSRASSFAFCFLGWTRCFRGPEPFDSAGSVNAGGGDSFTSFISLLRYLLTSFLPKTAAPFPQRWGQLRKGRAVFRREDRVDRLTVANDNDRLRSPRRPSLNQLSGGGGGGASGAPLNF